MEQMEKEKSILLSVYFYTFLFVCLSAYSLFFQYFCLFFFAFLSTFLYLRIHLSPRTLVKFFIFLSFRLFLYAGLFTCSSFFHLPQCLSACQVLTSQCLSVCLSIFESVPLPAFISLLRAHNKFSFELFCFSYLLVCIYLHPVITTPAQQSPVVSIPATSTYNPRLPG